MERTTRTPDDFHLRVVVDRLAREGRSQREIEAVVARLAPAAGKASRRSRLPFVRRLAST